MSREGDIDDATIDATGVEARTTGHAACVAVVVKGRQLGNVRDARSM